VRDPGAFCLIRFIQSFQNPKLLIASPLALNFFLPRLTRSLMESACLRLRPSRLPIPVSQPSPLRPRSISFPSTLHFYPLHSSPFNTRRKLLPLLSNPNPEGDLAPIPLSSRTFTAWDLASLWIGLVVGVPSYYLAGSLVDLGMSWLQGVSTVFLANALLLIPLLLTAYPATSLGIPFPVLARASFGPRGSHIPSLLRALVACGWFGIESWIGGQTLFLLLFNSSPSPSSFRLEFACFLLFWFAQLAIVLKGKHFLQFYNQLIMKKITE
jgi:Permease for cytosine/purines, uracil, thiamine, allantoin